MAEMINASLKFLQLPTRWWWIQLRFRGSVITSDGGLLAYRELHDALALTASGGERLAEARTGRNRRHLLGEQGRYVTLILVTTSWRSMIRSRLPTSADEHGSVAGPNVHRDPA
jgi:hypothetical protein